MFRPHGYMLSLLVTRAIRSECQQPCEAFQFASWRRYCFQSSLLPCLSSINCQNTPSKIRQALTTTHHRKPSRSGSNNKLAEDETIPILFEDDHILAINKPCGVAHHNSYDGPDERAEYGILSRMRTQRQRQYEVTRARATVNQSIPAPTPPSRLYGVHRLDRVTSGILLFAKDRDTAKSLTRAFRGDDSSLVVKYYTGISYKAPSKKKQGWVKGPMRRGRRKSWYLETSSKKSTVNKKNINFAKTQFFTAGLGNLAADSAAVYDENETPAPRTLLLFRPYTGKTHQLRVAAKSVGLPLAGDPIYGGSSSNHKQHDRKLRTYLHATALHIPCSDSSADHKITLWCPPPFDHLWTTPHAKEEFHDILQQLLEKHCDCHAILRAAKLALARGDGLSHSPL